MCVCVYMTTHCIALFGLMPESRGSVCVRVCKHDARDTAFKSTQFGYFNAMHARVVCIHMHTKTKQERAAVCFLRCPRFTRDVVRDGFLLDMWAMM